jgi:N-acetylated-alpha-linked acidic dipeptidase
VLLISVESLVDKNLDSQPDFSALRNAISDLQSASAALDEEKQEALEEFKKLIEHLPPYPSALLVKQQKRFCTKGPLDKWNAPPQTFVRKLKDWVKGIFGVPSATVTAASWDISKIFGDDTWESILEHVYPTTGEADYESLPPWLPGPVKKFIKAARRLGRCNKRLIAFERGFISEEGIKDREWYRHLGVAPGKWLGMSCLTDLDLKNTDSF